MAFGPTELVFISIGLLVLLLAVLVVIQAKRDGREGWWIYLIALFFSPINLVVVIAWFTYLKYHPVQSSGRPFL